MINSLLLTVFFLAGMTGLIVSIAILCRKENFEQNALLSICLFVLSFAGIYSFYMHNGHVFSYPKAILALKSVTFLVAPCAYLYISKAINPSFRFRWRHLLHFVPVLLSLGYMVTNATRFVALDFWTSNNMFFNIDFYTFNIMVNLLWLLYAYTQNLTIAVNRNSIAFLTDARIKWLKVFSLLIMLLFSSMFIQKVSSFSAAVDFNMINNTIIAVILLSSGYIVFFRPSVFFDINEPEKRKLIMVETITHEVVPDCRQTAGYLSNEKIKDYTCLIERALVDKPFLKKGFVIRDLADMTDIPVHHLSHFINSQYSLHFQDFINKRRIEYLLEQIDDKEWRNLSLEGQAWAVGFKSRTTFFRAFIKLTGQSPSEYISALKPETEKIYPAIA